MYESAMENIAVESRPSQRIYVASSWRNMLQQGVVHTLRAAKFEVYDFKAPGVGRNGFKWSDVDLQHSNSLSDTDPNSVDLSDAKDYIEALQKPRAEEGFNSDFDAMKWADTFVLVLPCGRSAHLELGWAVGAGKRTAILLEDPCTPELMYKMVDYLAPNLFELLGWLGVED